MPDRISRRAFLVAGGAGAASLTLWGVKGPARALAGGPSLGGYPFVAGVASGDPRAGGVVLWTRLALDPLGEHHLPPKPVPVRWQVSSDEAMTRVVREGVATAKPGDGHSVHVELEGLQPGREYWYRFYAGGEASPTGRTRTAPALGAPPATLTFCLASCSQFEHGYFTAYRRMAEDDPSFVVHVGDYIYEYATDEYLARDGNIRHHVGGETWTLADYRRRYGQYHSDEDLREARRLVPFVTVPDDHEVENNYARAIPEQDEGADQDPVAFARRRAAALQRLLGMAAAALGAARPRRLDAGCSGPCPSGTWRSSWWPTRGRSAPTSRAATSSTRPALSRTTPRRRSRACRRSSGSSIASAQPGRAGRSSPSRCRWPSRTSRPATAAASTPTPGTAIARAARGCCAALRRRARATPSC